MKITRAITINDDEDDDDEGDDDDPIFLMGKLKFKQKQTAP